MELKITQVQITIIRDILDTVNADEAWSKMISYRTLAAKILKKLPWRTPVMQKLSYEEASIIIEYCNKRLSTPVKGKKEQEASETEWPFLLKHKKSGIIHVESPGNSDKLTCGYLMWPDAYDNFERVEGDYMDITCKKCITQC